MRDAIRGFLGVKARKGVWYLFTTVFKNAVEEIHQVASAGELVSEPVLSVKLFEGREGE